MPDSRLWLALAAALVAAAACDRKAAPAAATAARPAPAGADATIPSGVPLETDPRWAKTADWDEDGLVEADDNCPTVYNPSQADADKDGDGDACTLAAFAASTARLRAGESATFTVSLASAAERGSRIAVLCHPPAIPEFSIEIPAGASTGQASVEGKAVSAATEVTCRAQAERARTRISTLETKVTLVP